MEADWRILSPRVDSWHPTPPTAFRSEKPCQECAKASVICVCADDGANYRGDVSVVYPACHDPHQKNRLRYGSWSGAAGAVVRGDLHRQGTVSDAAWRLHHENSVCSFHPGSCSATSKCVAAADGSSPAPPHRPKGCESGVCGAWTNPPHHVSTAEQSGSHGSALPPLHRHPGAASSMTAIDPLPRLTRAAPNSAPCACARDPMSHPGHAPIAARVPQPRPPALVPCGPHAAGPRVLCEFRRRKGPASGGCSCCGHPCCE